MYFNAEQKSVQEAVPVSVTFTNHVNQTTNPFPLVPPDVIPSVGDHYQSIT